MRTHQDRVTILNAPEAEGYGGQSIRQWQQATATQVPATVQPFWAGGSEQTDRRDTTVSNWRIFVNPDAPLDYASRVIWEGAAREGDPQGLLEVEGDVGLFKFGRRPHHKEATLRRTLDA